MSNNQNNNGKGAPERHHRGFGGGRAAAVSVERAKDFWGTLRRLVAYLKPQALAIIFVIIFTILSVVFTVSAPKIIGKATNVLFEGIVSKQLSANMTKDQIIADLKDKGQDQLAEMISAMDVTPGKGIDFVALQNILITLLGIYLSAAFFQWLQQYTMAGVAQRTVYKLRKDVDSKLAKLPLKYYDNHSHGDILSRVTNDVEIGRAHV